MQVKVLSSVFFYSPKSQSFIPICCLVLQLKAYEMFSEMLMACLLVGTVFHCVHCCAADEMKNTEEMNGVTQNNETLLDQEATMAMCNETFRTPMGTLLNLKYN